MSDLLLQEVRAKLAAIQERKDAAMAAVKAKGEDEAAANPDAAPAPSTAGQPAETEEVKTPGFSVCVRHVHYSVTKTELEDWFGACGKIKRSTILTDHYTHKSKGVAYVEFEEPSGMENALKLDEKLFKGQTIRVVPKKENTKPYTRRNSSPRRRFRRH